MSGIIVKGIFDPLDKNCYDFRKLFRKIPFSEKKLWRNL